LDHKIQHISNTIAVRKLILNFSTHIFAPKESIGGKIILVHTANNDKNKKVNIVMYTSGIMKIAFTMRASHEP